MVAIISAVIGRPVSYHELALEDLRAMMLQRGASPGMAQAVVEMTMAVNDGIYDLVRASSENAPTTFRQWCEDVLKPVAFLTNAK